jgi:hypothetical protein
MKLSGTFTRGFLVGVGLMYLMDPTEGGRRRARVRDKGARAWHRSSRIVGKTGRDLRNRARGRIAGAVPSVPGVVDVENRLQEHETGERIPALQGGIRRGREAAWLPQSWARSIQVAAAGLGAMALVYGASRAIRERREGRHESQLAPNYAYLR